MGETGCDILGKGGVSANAYQPYERKPDLIRSMGRARRVDARLEPIESGGFDLGARARALVVVEDE